MILHEMPLEELSVQLGSGGEDDGKEENAYEKSLAVDSAGLNAVL